MELHTFIWCNMYVSNKTNQNGEITFQAKATTFQVTSLIFLTLKYWIVFATVQSVKSKKYGDVTYPCQQQVRNSLITTFLTSMYSWHVTTNLDMKFRPCWYFNIWLEVHTMDLPLYIPCHVQLYICRVEENPTRFDHAESELRYKVSNVISFS